MSVRKLLDQLDDDGPRVFTPDGRRIRGRTEWERHVLREAGRMRAAGEVVGQVGPMPVAAALDLEQIAKLAAHLRMVLGQIDAERLDASPAMRNRIEGAAVALEAIRDEPAPVDLDRLP
jgi:hypothetical protein